MLGFASEQIGDWDVKKLYNFILNVIDQTVAPDIQARIQALVESGAVPTGTIVPFGGTQVPPGWLLCDGSAHSRFDFSDLFAVIGTAFGAGDGSTTFNVPDLRDRVPRGTSGAVSIGDTTNGTLPAHQHGITTDGTHSHGLPSTQFVSVDANGSFMAPPNPIVPGINVYLFRPDGAHNHGGATQSFGSGNAVIPKSVATNYIIKT